MTPRDRLPSPGNGLRSAERPVPTAHRLLVAPLVASLVATPMLIAGCATVPTEVAAPREPVVVAARESFEAAGRIAATRGTEGFSGSFRWNAAPGNDRVDLATPLGQTVARLESSNGVVRLVTSEGQVREAPSWEALTERELGWPLPVGGLRYWIQGAPRPGSSPARETDGQGRVESMRQDGWEIYFRYRDETSQPSSVRLQYPGVDVRIAVDSIR